MTKFITNKMLKIASGVLLTTTAVAGTFAAIYFGSKLIYSNFAIGSMLIAFAPLVIFLTAFYYQSRVVFSIRQVIVESCDKMSQNEKRFVKSAKSSYGFAKYIPLIITALASFLSVTIIPGLIGHAALENGKMIEVGIASLLISANLILFMRMTNQIALSISKNKVKL
ncbi:hypothetical protein [Psychromonas sp. SP041]|uniref:hypothetical protein n=1 Tax=Psychromonas sp. SP041 TaxID=1365007 RepID=UPI0010C7766F|nr:hypothetical protein [Psychromonas sp. SP041]